MTGRAVREWIGRTPDSKIPERVRRRVFDAWDGRCYLTRRKIDPVRDEWQIEHVKALCNGGENRERAIWAPVLIEPHKVKTRSDRAEKDKVEAVRRKHLFGHVTRTRPLPGGRESRLRKPIFGNAVPRYE